MKKELTTIVGSKYVSDAPKVLKAYSKDHSFGAPRVPNYIVKPKSAGEVQEVIKLANERRMPVVPCSSGVHFNGTTVPGQGGIILDLGRMNNILEIDERNRKVKIEPGVTWGQLQSELEEHELMALIPLLPHPKKSALTSHLEREPLVIPKFEYGDPLLTMEVVFPGGDLFRTGSAVVTGALADAVADEDWKELVDDHDGVAGSFAELLRLVRQVAAGKLVTDSTAETIKVYDADGVTLLVTLTMTEAGVNITRTPS